MKTREERERMKEAAKELLLGVWVMLAGIVFLWFAALLDSIIY